MATYTILHRGVPVGQLELAELPAGAGGARVSASVTPLAGYDAIRPLVRAASRAGAALAVGADTPGLRQFASAAALERNVALGAALELRDAAGALVPTDSIELTEWPGGRPELAATLGLRGGHAGVPAPHRSPPGEDAGSESPAG